MKWTRAERGRYVREDGKYEILHQGAAPIVWPDSPLIKEVEGQPYIGWIALAINPDPNEDARIAHIVAYAHTFGLTVEALQEYEAKKSG